MKPLTLRWTETWLRFLIASSSGGSFRRSHRNRWERWPGGSCLVCPKTKRLDPVAISLRGLPGSGGKTNNSGSWKCHRNVPSPVALLWHCWSYYSGKISSLWLRSHIYCATPLPLPFWAEEAVAEVPFDSRHLSEHLASYQIVYLIVIISKQMRNVNQDHIPPRRVAEEKDWVESYPPDLRYASWFAVGIVMTNTTPAMSTGWDT